MKFFIPHASDAEQAESVLKSICSFNKTSIPAKRIYKLHYTHNKISMSATIGEPADPYYREKPPEVIAIIPLSGCFAICLPNRGVVRGSPILVSDGFDTHVEYFE